MHRYERISSSRIFINKKLRLFFTFVCLLFVSLFLLRRPIRVDSQRKPLDLLNRQKILVPVAINRLYDYRVVCGNKNDILNRDDLIRRLIKTCHININDSLKVNLHPPDDFQIRSLSTTKYVEQWKSMESCPVYENETIAIVIPYRDREENLRNLLYNLIPLLQRQKINNYKIFIIEQQTSGPFNKGRLFNIAFHHLMKTYKPTCIIFHDVDLIPETNQNLYSCSSLTEHPLHMSAYVRFRLNGTYTTLYPFLVGGVLTIRPQTFTILNGYSNKYFNWGGEDDDMGLRFLSKDICVQRPKNGYYYAHSHSKQTRNTNRFKLLFDAVLRQDVDGLNSIVRLAAIDHVYTYSFVTWMTVRWIDHRLE